MKFPFFAKSKPKREDVLEAAIKCSTQRKVLTYIVEIEPTLIWTDFWEVAHGLDISLSESSNALNALRNKGYVNRKKIEGSTKYTPSEAGVALVNPPEEDKEEADGTVQA